MNESKVFIILHICEEVLPKARDVVIDADHLAFLFQDFFVQYKDNRIDVGPQKSRTAGNEYRLPLEFSGFLLQISERALKVGKGLFFHERGVTEFARKINVMDFTWRYRDQVAIVLARCFFECPL